MSALAEWDQAWSRICRGGSPPGLVDELVTAYGEPHRAYHTLVHVEDCLARMDEVRGRLREPDEVALALWFHDALYDPRRSDNEARSADWAEQALRKAQSGENTVRAIRDLILATRHDAIPGPGDMAFLVAIDLTILGADPRRFDEYEGQVRREYAWVDEPLFRAARAEILRRFLDRPHVYCTDIFRDRLEARARENLRRSLARLCAACP
jgi:predicted metal-dependent HD superfamily phosphohydrolase